MPRSQFHIHMNQQHTNAHQPQQEPNYLNYSGRKWANDKSQKPN